MTLPKSEPEGRASIWLCIFYNINSYKVWLFGFFMPINPMMYRVFLQDAEGQPGAYVVGHCMILAWSHSQPDWRPSLRDQLRIAIRSAVIGPGSEPFEDGHWPINCNGRTLGVVHKREELSDRTYNLALGEAVDLANELTVEKGKPYVFINATSRGDRVVAERLAGIVYNEVVEAASPSARDIGD